MVRGLDAIRNFLDLDLQVDGHQVGIIFVISCDEDRVAEALFSKRYRAGAEDLPGTVFSKTDARRYLDRLFQFRLEIPPFPKQDMRHFARKKIAEAVDVETALTAKNVPIDIVIDRLIHVGVQSPRNAIQLLNAFLQSWWIAVQREAIGETSADPGGLYAGSVTDHPEALAALTVLKVDFPDFYDRVQTRPEFLTEFREVVFGQGDANALPVDAQLLIGSYLEKKDDKFTREMPRSHRALRQYLASLESLRLPRRLQPLLRLAVDPVSRRLGDGAATVNDALVSGDVRGVLDALGRALDNNPLSADQAQLLQDLTEGAMQETEARRINTSRVLAALVDRIPDNKRRALLTPLVRQMVALRPVRQEVGPKAAAAIIESSRDTDQKEVAAAFISDLLHGGSIDWTKPGGGKPNLDELTEIVKQAIDLCLAVWSDHDISPAAKSMLRMWLLKREVRSEGESKTLPFSYLDHLVDYHASVLLPDLNPDYADGAIGVLQTEAESLRDEDDLLERLRNEFARLAQAGQDERQVLWEFLTRLVAVRSASAATLAWTEAGNHKDLATGNQAMGFMAAFASRLEKHLSDKDKWPISWSDSGAQFVDLLNNWRAFLTTESASDLHPVVTRSAMTRQYESLGISSLEILRDAAKDAWDTDIAALHENKVLSLPERTISYIAKNASSLAEADAKAISDELEALVNGAAPKARAAASYLCFMHAVPQSAWRGEPWSGHLSTAMRRASQMHSDASFLKAVLPAIVPILSSAADGAAAAMIKPLFRNAAGSPDAYAVAHEAFIGNWPAQDAQIGDYDPKALVERVCQFIRENGSSTAISPVFRSAVELAEKGIAPRAVIGGVSDITPIVWRTTPEAVSESAIPIKTIINPKDTAELLTGAQPADTAPESLRNLVHAIADGYDDGQLLETTETVLQTAPVEIAGEPDGALEQWVTAMGDRFYVTATTLLGGDQLSDAQTLRLLHQLPTDFWLGLGKTHLASLVTSTDKPKSQAHILSVLQGVINEARAASVQSDLSKLFIETLPKLSVAHVTVVGRAVSDLGGLSQLERADEILDALDDEQFRALLDLFPTSRAIQRRRAE